MSPGQAAPPATLERDATYDAIRNGAVGLALAFEVVRVVGPDALSYLQGQVSQDLDGLAVGRAVESLILSPQGKFDAFCRVVRLGEQEAAVVVDTGYGESTHDRLRRFKVRVKVDLELVALRALRIAGPGSDAVPAHGALETGFSYPGFSGRDVFGDDLGGSVVLGDAEAFEAARIEAGIPVMGREITDKTIPQETGIVERTVSFTKGCYTGQELVARIDARGNRVPRRLVGFVADGRLEAQAAVTSDGREVGQITSAAYSPGLDKTVALGYLKRDVAVPASVVVAVGGSPVLAEALALPLHRA